MLFGVRENNIPIPDIGGRVEIKTIRRDSQSLITLFTFNKGVWHMKQNELINTYGDEVLSRIADIDKNRAYDVLSFYMDYEKSINNVSKVIKRNGIVAYVVGNRKVKGIEIPNDEITVKFFERNGFSHIKTVIREIPNKRMPKRNSPSNIAGITDTTMSHEYIVILKKE
ncbi:hypothetical protein [Hydrogenobacter thermophilus]|uniref:hypothetical protein n=1 Tax=Hydrogenobacter thermophilus TaxID=940 RepID=UPI0030F4FF4C